MRGTAKRALTRAARLGAFTALIAAVCLLAASAGWRHTASPAQRGAEVTGVVEYVADGDTVYVRADGRKIKVRLIGLDAPEISHPDQRAEPYGEEASRYARDLLLGKTVSLEYDECRYDKYGRDLCYVWLDGALVNEELLRQGCGALFTYPPNVRYVKSFERAAAQAKRERLGMWAD